MPALTSLVFSAIVLVLVILALLISNPKPLPSRSTAGSTQTQRIAAILQTLSFGSAQAVLARERTPVKLETVLKSFDQALTNWFDATPQANRPVLDGEVSQFRRSLKKFTPHFVSSSPAQARLEADSSMRDAAKSCLTASDRDLDRDRENELLQSPLKYMIELAGLTLVDPQPGTTWPPRASGTRSRGRRVGRCNTRGLATEERVLLEPEIQEIA